MDLYNVMQVACYLTSMCSSDQHVAYCGEPFSDSNER